MTVFDELTGTKTRFFKVKDQNNQWNYEVLSRMQNKHKYHYPEEVLELILALAEDQLGEFVDEFYAYAELCVFTGEEETKLEKQIYRASPFYDGKPWNDWAILELGESERPAQLMCFLDLTNLPEENPSPYNSSYYALIRPAAALEDDRSSEFFSPYTKMIDNTEDGSVRTRIRFAEVDLITGPVILIPDLDNPNPRAYLRMMRRTEWTNSFEEWLMSEHTRMFDTAQEEPEIVTKKKAKQKRKLEKEKSKQKPSRRRKRTKK